MSDQKQHWNNLHSKGSVDHDSNKPTDFVVEVSSLIIPPIKILELGCGVGNDSIFFAENGNKVLGTDFSEVAIENNNQKVKELSNLKFERLDISGSYPYKDSEFDLVYARLSLHYFTDSVTRNIFREIHRILKSGGLLCFICKSTKDPLYGKGKQIEKDMFEFNGHVRHFFSEQYVKECLAGLFSIERLESGEEKFYDSNSAFIKVIARVLK